MEACVTVLPLWLNGNNKIVDYEVTKLSRKCYFDYIVAGASISLLWMFSGWNDLWIRCDLYHKGISHNNSETNPLESHSENFMD